MKYVIVTQCLKCIYNVKISERNSAKFVNAIQLPYLPIAMRINNIILPTDSPSVRST